MATGPDREPHAVLGVARDASPLQVARAHRRLAKRFHPDLHPDGGTAARMREINEAYRTLRAAARARAENSSAAPAPAAPTSSHWAPSRQPIRPAQASNTRTWASWRASADETRASPATRRAPGEVHAPATRRPGQLEPVERRFGETGWAAILMAAAFLVVMGAAMVAGRLASLP